ncbi:alginate lyase family protein [Granulicella tundricola]|uniref:Alginate lyase domain-containing protein n=1 Tax=Granulicella tundricola (strain ATCC BAA-1859 / DSM 23138 / MP5ACTX9) TaxID=1198114 RepID=E8WZC3_GRATM|nr:alginate lyase family protein [Granulicella tundricola]ADW68811.1 hypothetical protein AciX9_1763 [Granulicella tundricola MP5ACTX9]
MPTRRAFCQLAAATLAAPHLRAQTTRPNLREIDHDSIQAAASKALARPVTTGTPDSQAFLDLTLDIPALAAANYLTPDPSYPGAALKHLTPWFVSTKTKLPTLTEHENDILLTAPLAELAVALPFLGLTPPELAEIKLWFAEYLTWLNESRTALLARDSKDHHASSWLLQVAAYAHLTANDAILTENRHRFKSQTIRAQIEATGLFPHELPMPDPFRNSLMNLDLLAGACVLLSTQFDSVWDHELQDGPGMRAAISRHAPYIEHPTTWPYPADQTHFHELPCRRPALLFAARAYSQVPYADLWRTLKPDPTSPEILRAFPIRQPILWLAQPRFVPI